MGKKKGTQLIVLVDSVLSNYVYGYDNMSRITSIVGNRRTLLADFVVGANVARDFKNEYWFDALNRVSVQTQTSQGSGLGFMLVQDKRFVNTYNALGQVTFQSRFQNLAGTGDNLRTVSQYDTANRLSTLSHRNIGTSTTVLSNYVFGYDNMSRITSINHTALVAANADGLSNFSYDKTSQLTTADHAPARPDENLSYDLNGNRTGGSYVTQSNNLTTEDTLYTYSYDKEGNRVQRTLKSNGSYEQFLFDHRNRLVQHVSRNAANQMTGYVTYSLDTFNRMVFRREVATNPSTGTATSVRDNWFAGFDGINSTLEFETSGTTSAPNAVASNITHRLWWGQGVDQLLADEQYSGSVNPATSVGTTIWALADHLGTIRDLATFNGTSFSIANHRVFDSFGNMTSQTNAAITTAYRYTGKWFDSRTGLSYHWNRWYDPKLGKWISEDPIGFASKDANLGRYVGNFVTGMTDSTGLFGDPITILMPNGNPITLYPPVDADVIKRLTDQGGVVVQGSIPETKPMTPDWIGESVFSAPEPPQTPIDPNNPGVGWVKSPEDPKGNTWTKPGTNPGTRPETLHNDLNHQPGKPPHWSWKDKHGNNWEYFPHEDKWRPKPGNKNRPEPNFPPGQFEDKPWKPGLVTSVGNFFAEEWRKAEIRSRLEDGMAAEGIGPFATPNAIPNLGGAAEKVPSGAGGRAPTKIPLRISPALPGGVF